MFNVKNLGKFVLPVAGLALTIASSVINDKIKDEKLNETVTKKVAEALADKKEEA